MQNEGFQRWVAVRGGEVRSRQQLFMLAYRTPQFAGAAQHLFAPVGHGHLRQVVAAHQGTVIGGSENRRLQQALVIAQQIDGAEGALGPGWWIEEYQVELTLCEAWIIRQLLPASLGDR